MFKIYKSIIWLLFIVALSTLFACRKNISEIFSDKRNIETQWAQDYFNNVLQRNDGNEVLYKKFNKVSSLNSQGKAPNMKTPMWLRARASKTPIFEFVEIPLMYTRKISASISVNGPIADPSILKASFDRLVIYKDKDGRIDQRIITYIPNKDYLERHKGDISHNKIENLDKDFDGYLVYKDWSGNRLFVLRIKDGLAHKLRAPVASLKLNKLASIDKPYDIKKVMTDDYGDCIFTIEYEWEQTCYYNNPDDVNPSYCDDPVIVSETVISVECPGDGNGEGGPDCSDPANFNNGECQPPPPDDPCNGSKAAAAQSVNNMVNNNSSILGAFNSVIQSSANGYESAFRIDKGADGNYSATSPVQAANPGDPYSSTPTYSNTVAIGHGHDASSFPQPSPADFYISGELASQSNGFLSTSYILSASSAYAIVVTDLNLFSAFLANYPKSTNIDDYSGDFKSSSTLYTNTQEIGQNAYNADPRSLSSNPAEIKAAEISANEVLLVYFLAQYNTGITLLKKDSSGSFKPLHFTKTIQNGKTIIQVSPCN